MMEMNRAHPMEKPPTSWPAARPFTAPIELWRLRGATDDLRGLVIETSFGYAFGLELDAELVLLLLQPSLERFIEYADRLEGALLKQGWRLILNSVSASTDARHAARPFTAPIELWRLRGATDDLRGLVIETSFGYAFGLELEAELVLLLLQPSLERLIEYADRLEGALLNRGGA
jgi:hypothetical protein